MKTTQAPSADVQAAELAGLPAQDFARYLELFASQVAVSAQESEEPVAALAHSMLAIAASAQEILAALRRAPGASGSPARQSIERHCTLMLERVQLAVVAFQFHDLLTQRLQHVRAGLAELADTLKDPRPRTNAGYWRAVGERIRGRYSLYEQGTLFDEVVNGITARGDAAAEEAGTGHWRVELF